MQHGQCGLCIAFLRLIEASESKTAISLHAEKDTFISVSRFCLQDHLEFLSQSSNYQIDGDAEKPRNSESCIG